MAEYIERETVLKIIGDNCPHDKGGYNTEEEMGAGSAFYYIRRAVETVPTADVVPKSECDECQERVLKNFDDLRDFYQKQIDYLLSKNDELKQENETLKDTNEHLAVLLEESKQAYANYEETPGLKQAKQEVAMDILAKIAEIADQLMNSTYYSIGDAIHDIAELTKEYTEEKT